MKCELATDSEEREIRRSEEIMEMDHCPRRVSDKNLKKTIINKHRIIFVNNAICFLRFLSELPPSPAAMIPHSAFVNT
jgi:hypothetical protein